MKNKNEEIIKVLHGKITSLDYEKNRAIDLYQKENEKNKTLKEVLERDNEIIFNLNYDIKIYKKLIIGLCVLFVLCLIGVMLIIKV